MTGILVPFLRTIKAIVPGLVATFTLAACSNSPAQVGEVKQLSTQIQATAQTLQPANTQQPDDTQALQSTNTQQLHDTQSPSATQVIVATREEPAGSGISACALVTKEEAEAAVGSPVGELIEENYPPLYGCRYASADFNYLGVSLVEYDSEEQAGEAFQMELDLNDYEEVSGIGDRALRPAITDISILQGKYELSIDVVNDSDEEAQYEKAKELAMIALSRLP
jgi:hypothetical protein